MYLWQIMNTKGVVKCVHCGEAATKVIYELGVEIPLCSIHYAKYVDEEDGLMDIEQIVEADES